MIYQVPQRALAEVRTLVAAAMAAQDRVSSAARAIMHMMGIEPDDPSVTFDAVKGTIEVPDPPSEAAPLPSHNGASVPLSDAQGEAPAAG